MIFPVWARQVRTFVHYCCQHCSRSLRHLGFLLAEEKTVGPATVLSFLGIVIDTEKMECRLSEDKVRDLRVVVDRALRSPKIRLPNLQSLLEKLNFACRIMPMGRIFCRRG